MKRVIASLFIVAVLCAGCSSLKPPTEMNPAIATSPFGDGSPAEMPVAADYSGANIIASLLSIFVGR